MSELKPTCCKVISYNGWPQGKCGKPSKIEYEGRHYCGIHNPIAKAEKNAIKNAAWKAEREANDAAQAKALAARKELERRAACFPELLKALQQANTLLAELTHTAWITGTDAASIDIRQRIKAAHQVAYPAIAKALGEPS